MKFFRQKINLLHVALNYSKLLSNPLILYIYIPIMQKRKKLNSKSDFFFKFLLARHHIYKLFSPLTVCIKRNVSFPQIFNNLSILFLRSSKSLIFPRMGFVGIFRNVLIPPSISISPIYPRFYRRINTIRYPISFNIVSLNIIIEYNHRYQTGSSFRVRHVGKRKRGKVSRREKERKIHPIVSFIISARFSHRFLFRCHAETGTRSNQLFLE